MRDLKKSIPGDLPFGIFIKGDKATYRALRNAFNSSQAAWRSFSETPEALVDSEKANANVTAWAGLAEQCETCLTEISKDLEVLSWFVAAQLHGPDPLTRCAQAVKAMTELVETSVDDLQPTPPPEKLRGDTDEARAAEVAELRIRPFVQLFGEVEGGGLLNGPLTNLPLIGEVSYGKFLLAEKDGKMDGLRSTVAAHIGAEAEVLTQKIEALQEMSQILPRLDASMKSYAARHSLSPPLITYGTRLVVDVLRAAQQLVEGLGFPWPGQNGEDAGPEVPADDVVSEQVETSQPKAEKPRSGLGGFDAAVVVANRQDALMAIAQLARYFRNSEPHSPICLLLDRAVRWGNLNAAELYREILSDGSVGMSQMALMTGLESQGFADNFGRRGAGAAGGVEHPTLDNYAAAVPVPSAMPASLEPPAVVAAAPAPVAVQAAVAQPEEELAVIQAEPEVGPEEPIEDFQW